VQASPALVQQQVLALRVSVQRSVRVSQGAVQAALPAVAVPAQASRGSAAGGQLESALVRRQVLASPALVQRSVRASQGAVQAALPAVAVPAQASLGSGPEPAAPH